MIIVWFIQGMVCWFLIAKSEINIIEEIPAASRPELSLMRLIVTLVTHVTMQEGIVQGMSMMKFALNHHWKFWDYNMAFVTGFLQVMVNIFIEFATYYVLLFDSPEMLDMLANFAIVIMIV